jgi:hypothetical protein
MTSGTAPQEAVPLEAGYVAQKRFIGHGAHLGLRGVHHVAPKSMSAWLKS